MIGWVCGQVEPLSAKDSPMDFRPVVDGKVKSLHSRSLSPKTRQEMIRKFAVLAVVASLFVACGSGKTPEQLEAELKAAADSATAAMEQSMKEAEAKAQAIADSTAAAAAAMVDTAAAKVEGAVTQ